MIKGLHVVSVTFVSAEGETKGQEKEAIKTKLNNQHILIPSINIENPQEEKSWYHYEQ
jgi:hypothetical protein